MENEKSEVLLSYVDKFLYYEEVLMGQITVIKSIYKTKIYINNCIENPYFSSNAEIA